IAHPGNQVVRHIVAQPSAGLVARALLLASLFLAGPLEAQDLSGGGDGDPTHTIVTDFPAVQRSKVYAATRIADAIVVDGLVDEPAWERAEVGRDFYQTDPTSGAPATEETEFRI